MFISWNNSWLTILERDALHELKPSNRLSKYVPLSWAEYPMCFSYYISQASLFAVMSISFECRLKFFLLFSIMVDLKLVFESYNLCLRMFFDQLHHSSLSQDGLTPLDVCLYSGQDTKTYELIKLLKQLPKLG